MKFFTAAPLRKICLSLIALTMLAWHALAINNDGQTDILWHDFTTGGTKAWMMSGTTFVSESTLTTSDPSWTLVGTGDFNRDGQLDLLWHHPSDGQNAVWYMNGSTYVSAAMLPTSASNWHPVGLGYFDGYTDSKVDIFLRNTADGQLAIWSMDNTTLVNTRVLSDIVTDQNWKIGAIGDFNRDGQTDLAWYYETSGATAIWYLYNGAYSSSASGPTADNNWRLSGAGHFDTDGKLDWVWRHKTGQDTAVWFMDNATYLSSTLLTTMASNWVVGGLGDSKQDIDVDGLPDLWEKNHFGNLDQNAVGDYDADGFTNLQEYQNGTLGAVAELRVKVSRPTIGSNVP